MQNPDPLESTFDTLINDYILSKIYPTPLYTTDATGHEIMNQNKGKHFS